MIAFICALLLTTVTSVMVFQAVSPLLAWICLRERLTRRTLFAIVVAFAGWSSWWRAISGAAGSRVTRPAHLALRNSFLRGAALRIIPLQKKSLLGRDG